MAIFQAATSEGIRPRKESRVLNIFSALEISWWLAHKVTTKKQQSPSCKMEMESA
jgi:hypothetical protein